MGAGGALRAAAGDFYRQSWRLAIFNTALSTLTLGILYLALFVSAAFVFLLVVLGPFAAALMHCAVLLAQTEELRFRDAPIGLMLHWRRGLVLAVVLFAVIWLAVIAFRFYGADQWLLSVLAGDVLAVFVVLQLFVWPRAVRDRAEPLHRIFGAALSDFLNRPVPAFAFALALVLVNALGFVAAVMPLLTLTVAYSFLAAAHFALPRSAGRD